MTYPILVDIHEPSEVKLMLKQFLQPVIVQNNEPLGLADYAWNNGQLMMVERKTGRELLSTMGNKLDIQLAKYARNHPKSRTFILQEGLITPNADGGCYVWRRVKQKNRGKPIHVVSSSVPIPYTAYKAYIYQRMLEGFNIIITEDTEDTVISLSSMVFNSMKTEHKGLNPYVASKPNRKKVASELKGKVKSITTLMSFEGIGQATAEKLMTDHDTLRAIFELPTYILAEYYGERIANALRKGLDND